MTDEQRTIRITTVVNNATRDLNRIAGILDKVGTATGKSDKQLRTFDRDLARMSGRVKAAQQELKRLYDRTDALSKQNTQYRAKIKQVTVTMEEYRAKIKAQRAEIKSLIDLNKALWGAYDHVASSARKAGAAQRTAAQGAKAATGGAAPVANAGRVGSVQNNALRYQLYDVAATYGILGAAATAAGTAVARAGIQWDKNFAHVVRTSQVTGTAVGWLKDQFLELQTEIPVVAEDLAVIGTLGGQMGVAADNLTNFVETTAKFAATSNISVDESATALSRLDQLLPDVQGNYERLASTILRTGVNAVATEQQIVRGVSQIAAMGRIADLTTPEIVAMASAMSSIGFSPELQRSIVTSSFSRILMATSQVTEKTQKFGEVLNMTGEQFQDAWRSDALGTYRDLLVAISQRGDAVTVLKSLGLASQRLTPNLLKLGQNADVLNRALADTTDEWDDVGELTRQYGIISDTVSARLQMLAQTWEAFLVTIDETDVILKPILIGITSLLKGLRNVAKNPAIGMFLSLASVVGIAAGAIALLTSGMAALSAGYIAITAANAGLKAAVDAQTVSQIANNGAKAAGVAANQALAASTVGATGAITAQTGALAANTAAMSASGLAFMRMSSRIIAALPAVMMATGVIGGVAAAAGGLAVVAANIPDIAIDLRKWISGADTPQKALDLGAETLANFESQIEAYNDMLKQKPGDGAFSGSLGAQLYGKQTAEEAERLAEATKRDMTETVLGLETVEEKYAAVNYLARKLNVSREHLLTNILPDLGSALGEGAAGMAAYEEHTLRVESAQELWADSLLASDEALADLKESLATAAGGFLDFGSALEKAYDTSGKAGTGGGINAFRNSVTQQLKDFESFYGDLGKLARRGGVQLAAFFAEQGPGARQALIDSLKLKNSDIAKLEEQMALAAFYASEEFAQTFAQRNAVLAQVWMQTGNHKAVAAFSKALAASMKGGEIDPVVLAELAAEYEVKIDAALIPNLDPDVLENAVYLATGGVEKVTMNVETDFKYKFPKHNGTKLVEEINSWVVEVVDGSGELHSIALPVDPNTAEGARLIKEWRQNEYEKPVDLLARVNTNDATKQLNNWIKLNENRDLTMKLYMNPNRAGNYVEKPPGAKNGGFPAGVPRYAKGSSLIRGPGTGTSDSILALVSNGEAITRAAAVRHYGVKMFDDINRLKFPKFASGGVVGTSSSSSSAATTVVNATVVQNYPTTQDPIKKLREDAEAVLSGIWV